MSLTITAALDHAMTFDPVELNKVAGGNRDHVQNKLTATSSSSFVPDSQMQGDQMGSSLTRLDAEILLSYVLNVSRTYLFTWPEKPITDEQQALFIKLIERRIQGEPVPYLIGSQEFWSHNFIVTPDTLIPRPETELLVELALSRLTKRNDQAVCIADLGTGSGAIALSLAYERSEWCICATDQSVAALSVAKRNAKNLALKNVSFYQGHWCEALPSQLFDLIVSNPPYIAENDPHLVGDGVRFEPRSALTSGLDGLDAIREIINSASRYLKPGGCLMIEHGHDQASRVKAIFLNSGYKGIVSIQDLAQIERVTLGIA